MLSNKWSFCETFVLGNFYHMWLVVRVQSVTGMRRASVKSRYNLPVINTRSLKASSHAVCAQSFLTDFLFLEMCISSLSLWPIENKVFLWVAFFLYQVFLLPLILHLIRQTLYTDDPSMWSSPHQFLGCHTFLEQCEPGHTGWPLHWENGLSGQRSGKEELRSAFWKCCLAEVLGCSPSQRVLPALCECPDVGCACSHNPACGACSVQEQKLGRSLMGLDQALCQTQCW